jgi:transaldolase
MTTETGLRSPLQEMVATTATDFWNDSCSIEELTCAIENGAVGATSNPTIVGEVLAKEMDTWRDRIVQLARTNATWTEDQVTWRLIEEMAANASSLLLPVFERAGGRAGRLSIQTSPKLYRDPERLVDQAVRFGELAPNMQVKLPATRAGIEAIEEVTARGIVINATVSFTVPQAIAVAEAVERGLDRRDAAGADVESMAPVCTIMIGRLDDWLEASAAASGVLLTPGYVNWAGIACVKRAYTLYRERGYRTRVLAAAYRNHRHWSELIGGDIVLTIPAKWQRLFNASTIEMRPRFDEPVPAEALEELERLLPDFCRAYDPEGLSVDEFNGFGATGRTLRQFIASYDELVATVRDVILPSPG